MLKPLTTRLPFKKIALLLQGGGALGAYQGGVYQALLETGLTPDWVAGISIGAINAAIIAGNPPEQRLAKLKGFWETLTANPYWDHLAQAAAMYNKADAARAALNQASATYAMTSGVPGFFKPHLFPPFSYPPGTPEAISFYNADQLRTTLLQYVDFNYLNAGHIRLSVGAVNVKSGNFVKFDSTQQQIAPEHIMASGALPPGFAPVEIDGEHYWDGGLISNTPLTWLMEAETREDTLAFQVDLWSAEGDVPKTMIEVISRQKEIQYSSRTRAATSRFRNTQKLRHAFAILSQHLPPEAKESAEYKLLASAADHKVYNIVHLIYRSRHYEDHSKDYEFSRQSMDEHWLAGYHDTATTLRHPEIFNRPDNTEGMATFDLAKESI